MSRRFFTLDVFTETPLAGNPVAVVLDAEGLGDARMQAIAAEFNLSETVFVVAPKKPANAARLRIFTPLRELPFAGHPTIGTAALLAHVRNPDLPVTQDVRLVLEEQVGEIVCSVRRRNGRVLAAEFGLPKLPERLEAQPPSRAEIAEGVDLALEDIGFDGHEPTLYTAGAPYLFIPVLSLAAIGRARPGAMSWAGKDGPAAYLYTRQVVQTGSDYHARMFGGGWGVTEDPATGSAAAAFAGVAYAFDFPGDGKRRLIIEQGFEMGRPSLIALSFAVESGMLRSASISGAAVIVSSGSLDL